MATLFVDYENGNDNWGGTSFAVLASGTNGRISSNTFSATAASFPNDGSLINQYLSIFNGTIYATYQITAWVSSTSLTIASLSGGTALANQSVDRQYFIGGRWKTFNNGATAVRLLDNDTVRIMSSPDPTSIGSGTWTGAKQQPGSSINSSTNTSPIVVSCASTMATLGISNGDTVAIVGHTTNTNANGIWEVTNVSGASCSLVNSSGVAVGGTIGQLRKISQYRVLLNSSPIVNIASHGNRGNGRTAWTNVDTTNNTVSLNTTDFKEGDCSDSIVIGTNFTTGIVAYKTLSSSVNLSGYQQLSFWIKQTAGTIGASGAISLALCSDTLGATPVNTFNIENLVALNRWIPITIDLATNLGNNIQSIAFYVNTDNGAQTFLMNNIIACKSSSSADSLNLCSLIGKNTSGETWCGIQSINGTRVMLDTGGQAGPVNTSNITSPQIQGYYGTTETVTTFKRETIKTPMAATNTTTTASLLNLQKGGSSASNTITYSFGWDRSNMSSQTGQTWFDGRNGFGYMTYSYYITGGNVTIDRWCGIRFYQALFIPGCMYSTVSNCHLNNCDYAGLYPRETRNVTYNNIFTCYNGGTAQGQGIYAFANLGQTIFNNIVSNSNYGAGIFYYLTAGTNTVNNFTFKNNINGLSISQAQGLVANSGIITDNSSYGIDISSVSMDNIFSNCILSTNTIASIRSVSSLASYMINCSVNDTTETSLSPGYAQNSKIFSHNHDNITNNHYIFCEGGLIYATTGVVYSNTGIAWAMSPTSTVRYSGWPLDFAIAKVAVTANSLVTIKAWMRRSNTGLTTGLRIKGGQIAGVPNDITSYMSAVADTWQQVTLNFTPTEIGVVEILAECYGGTTFTAYIDDISITQT